jgi:NADH-quinone oxidoreductase subunit H
MFLFIYLQLGIFIIFILLLFIYYVILDIEILKVLPPLIPILLLVALFTLFERKILGGVQRRRGPNVVGIWGILQPFADAFKLIFKETIIPGLSNLFLFIAAPVFTFTLSWLSWSIIPLSHGVVLSDINLGLLFLFSISSLGVYGIIISGWSSNNKYAFLGALRSAAQFVSYEVSIGISIMPVLVCTSTLNLTNIVQFQDNLWFFLPLWPSLILFFIAALAETNRVPFDLPEAESELVSGYNVEYAATTFVLFFLAEYSNILIMSSLITIFFFGGWLPILNFSLFFLVPGWIWMSAKVCFIVFFFILIRATVPRYRYDQLMNIGWKVLLPISLAYLFFISVFFWVFIGDFFVV